MLDDWFRTIELKITFEEFHRLPRHPAYKQEYYGGRCVLTPRSKGYHAVLDLATFATPDEQTPTDASFKPVVVRPLADEDWDALPPVLAAAFHRVPPFGTLSADGEAKAAARDCLEHTRHGGDGPVVREACVVATSEDARLIGGLLVTLWPDRPLTEWNARTWPAPPPDDAVEQRRGRPHLTWIFVSPWHAGHGIGTAMLAATVCALRRLGYTGLATSFMSGNDSSMLWHWRNGFRLLEYPGSYRRMDREIRSARLEKSHEGK